MKSIYKILLTVGLLSFFSCKKQDRTKSYYDVNDYRIKDSMFNKKHILTQVNLVNKYDTTRKLVRVYWDNGIMAAEGFFHDDEKDGPFTTYYPDEAKIMAKGNYKDNFLDGKIVIYYENGNINKIMYFKKGNEVSTWETFDSTGHLIDSTVHK